MKSEQLQIRVSREEKESIRRRAKESGMEMSAWILAQLFSALRKKFEDLVRTIADTTKESDRFLAFAAVSDFLAKLDGGDLSLAVEHLDHPALTLFDRNYLAAMVEYASHQKKIQPPVWVHEAKGLSEPYFGSDLRSLRIHLLTTSPPPFRKRNIFVDSSIGDRV